MGLLGRNPQVSTLLARLPNVVDVMRDVTERLGARPVTPATQAAVTRWFGAGADIAVIRRMANEIRSRVNCKSIYVSSEHWRQRDIHTNASAYASAGVVPLGGDFAGVAPAGDADVFLDLNFTHLPQFLPLLGGQIDATGGHQSQLETLIHELSHLLLGTDDEVDPVTGQVAYGTQSALALVTNAADQARNNAENWGIFIEACGYHHTS